MANRLQFRRGTAALATSNNSILADGELGYETDTGLAKIGDGVTAWTSLPYMNAGPKGDTGDTGADGAGWPAIGDLYTRYPGEALPATKYGGTWSNVSSTWAGSFLRVEGGDASTYDTGQQGYQNKYHRHSVMRLANGSGSLVQLPIDTTSSVPTVYYTSYDGNVSDQEARPVNETIQIWRRTA